MNFETEYSKISSDYTEFLNEVKRIIELVISKKKIPLAFDVSGRLKELRSINEKHESKRFTIDRSITELDDLVGIRIVLLFPEFKNQVTEILRSEFKLVKEPKMNKKSTDTFGYSSTHLILGPKAEWKEIVNWEDHLEKKVEVQIRTLSEHIWSETSHSLFYKREESIPNALKRDRSKLAALLEVVDDKLDSLKKRVTEHLDYIATCPYAEILKLDLNSETFNRVMKENSAGLYDLDDYKNKALSSRVEHEFNIVTTIELDSFFKKNLIQPISTSHFIETTIDLLEKEKQAIDDKQRVANR
jgi:ppGpp synthetase/RelA/SpoT-type nucleotidyltranferase